MKAIILAAGEGKRLRPHTENSPKCLVKLAGKPLLEHQLQALRAGGIKDITIITGYMADKIKAPNCAFRHNSHYDSSNMVATLMCAEDILCSGHDILICYADIIYHEKIVEAMHVSPHPLAVSVDKSWRKLWQIRMDNPLLDAETMKISEDGYITELGKKPSGYDEIQGQYMGLIKVSKETAHEMVSRYKALDAGSLYDGKDPANIYMTTFLQMFIDSGYPVCAVMVNGGWLEVDTVEDLELYQQLQDRGELAQYCRL